MAESTNFRPFTVNGVLNTDFGARTSKDKKKRRKEKYEEKSCTEKFQIRDHYDQRMKKILIR